MTGGNYNDVAPLCDTWRDKSREEWVCSDPFMAADHGYKPCPHVVGDPSHEYLAVQINGKPVVNPINVKWLYRYRLYSRERRGDRA